MARWVPVGPGYAVINKANTPQTDSSWTVIKAREARFNLGLQSAFTTQEFAPTRTNDGLVQFPGEPTLQFQFLDAGLEAINALIIGGAIVSVVGPPALDALPIPDTLEFVDPNDALIVGFVPLRQASDGIDAANGIWLRRAQLTSFGEITYTRPEANQDLTNPYNVGFTAVLDVNESSPARIGWTGAPNALGFSPAWALPTLSEDFV